MSTQAEAREPENYGELSDEELIALAARMYALLDEEDSGTVSGQDFLKVPQIAGLDI